MKLQKSKKTEIALSEDLRTDDEWSDCVFKQVRLHFLKNSVVISILLSDLQKKWSKLVFFLDIIKPIYDDFCPSATVGMQS